MYKFNHIETTTQSTKPRGWQLVELMEELRKDDPETIGECTAETGE